jgi:predicted nucleotidyltransferase
MGKNKARLIQQLREFKQRNKISKLYLFGSLASGRAHKFSDVDLIVVANRFRGKGPLERAPRLYMDWNLDYPVDFLCYTPGEFNRLKKQITIVREAVEKGIEI